MPPSPGRRSAVRWLALPAVVAAFGAAVWVSPPSVATVGDPEAGAVAGLSTAVTATTGRADATVTATGGAAAPAPASAAVPPQTGEPLGPAHATPGGPPPTPAIPATLSFDDCGTAPRIAAILDQLDRLHLHAIFFPTGACRDQLPWLVGTLQARGHLVCNHTYSHPNLLRLSNGAIAREIAGGVHTQCTHFRPPYGAWDGPAGRVAQIARSQGYDILTWDVDSDDYRGASAALITARIRSTAGVVLLHMHGLHTVEALQQL